MVSILIVAHAPLASSLQALATHAYSECRAAVAAVDIASDAGSEQAAAAVAAALAALGDTEVLILTDVFGATPCTAALQRADGVRSRVVAGVNVPMLWRALCYREESLESLVTRAADGGRQGVMAVSVPRRQDQPKPPPNHDSDPDSDQ